MRIATAIALIAILILSGFSWQLSECKAQKRIPPAEYDYYSLAVTSILNSASEAAKLPSIPQRVRLLINAAKILPASQQDQAVRLLEVGLRDLQNWGSAEKASWYQQRTAAELRNDVLAVYAKLDPEKVIALRKEFQAATKSPTANRSETSLKREDWYKHFSDRRVIADQATTISLSLIDTDPEKALRLVAQSLQGGTVSKVLLTIVQKLIQNGNRTLLDRLEIGIGQSLTTSLTLDPFSVAFAASLTQVDKDMPSAAKSAFLGYFMRSLQALAFSVKEPGIDAFYISTAFTMFLLNVRPMILLYSPEQLLMFDSVLDQVASLVPAETRTRLQAFQPETFSEPRDRLNDILKDQNPDKRDLRLIGLVSGLLRGKSGDFQKNLDLAADAINGFSDQGVKSTYSDLFMITRADAFLKEKKFIEAQEVAGSISSEETRAWALLALSSVAAKSDQVLGFELISNALRALDKASPSPHKAELALSATGMLAKSDPQRAFDTFATAAKYANSSASRIDPAKPAVGFGIEATLGESHTRLGVFPESVSELEIDPSFAVLGTTDWFRADQIASDIREPSLRLQLKLQLAGAVLAKASKPNQKESAPKPSVKN